MKTPHTPAKQENHWSRRYDVDKRGRSPGYMTYPKLLRLACEKIAAERGLTNADDVMVELVAKGMRDALGGDTAMRNEVMRRVYPEPKEDQGQGHQTNVFLLSDERRDAIYKIANMHNDQEGGDRSLGTGHEGGAS